MYAKKEKIYPAYVSKHNSNREKQVIPLILSNIERWHYLAMKSTISIIKRSNVKTRCNVVMPSGDTKILEFNQYQKFNKAPFIINADVECLT